MKWKNFRVTEAEDRAIEQARGGKRLSAFCREAIVKRLKLMGYLKQGKT